MAKNIVLFVSDDHAQWASGCYGNTELRTPTLDHLAATGVLFENAFTPSPVCSPARASLLTGRLPSQHGVHDYLASADPDVRSVPWLQGEVLLPEILRGIGYQTGLSGKWHLGSEDPTGFDFWYTRSAPVSAPDGYGAPWPLEPSHERRYDHHAITDHALEFLRRRDRDRPFLLVVGHIATHSPWSHGLERLVSSYRDCTFSDVPQAETYRFGRLRSESLYATRTDRREALAQYYGEVSEIDEQVGRVVDELDTLALREDTVVIYTSDHGLSTGHHGIWGKGNATLPYNAVDESIRVPLIVNAPDASVGGQRRPEFVTHLDTFQTVLDLAGAKAPTDRRSPYPGRSYAPTLTTQPLGDDGGSVEDTVFAEYGTLRMVRTRDAKLVRRYPDGPSQLFDLASDPRETRDLLHDPAHATVLADLDARLGAYFTRFEEPAHRGVDVLAQPRHNFDEAWRDTSPQKIVESAEWLVGLEAEVQRRRTENGTSNG